MNAEQPGASSPHAETVLTSVIELPAHAIFRSRTEVGEQLLIDRYEARKVAEPVSATEPEKVAAMIAPSVGRSGSGERASARTAV
jgi:hypothetical protein